MTDGAGSPYGTDQSHGNIAEEAAKLAEAVQDWLGARTGRAPGDVWASATAAGGHSDQHEHDPPECQVCPLCRAMRFLGSMNPQVFAHLSDAAVSLSAAMRAMSEQNPGPPASGRAAEADDGEA